MISKKEALREIDEAQDFYVNQLAEMIRGKDRDVSCMKEIDFTSPTGTGKTVMVAKLINLFPSYYFVVTTLSRGQLRKQIESKLDELVKQNNFVVYGLNEFTTTTKLQRNDIEIRLPRGKKIIWIRDEGHIATNRWQEIFGAKAEWIINFSATNKSSSGIQCNFTHTMMLRTVTQQTGTIEAALDKLLEVKHIHSFVKNYNPCALFRILDDGNLELVFKACDERNLRYINITDQDFDMSDLCDDANPYDVIINKFKITEGIDLKRCHVIYMDSKPQNEATVVQIIGRGRRNALFWRDDIDILSPSLSDFLTETRRCYVFYNVPETEISVNSNGELSYTLCDTISIESLRPGVTIYVVDGQLPNGLKLLELNGKTGTYRVDFDKNLQCNIVDNPDFYEKHVSEYNPFVIDCSEDGLTLKRIFVKKDILKFFIRRQSFGKEAYDPVKYRFYILRAYSKQTNKDIDFGKWADYLHVERKDKCVANALWPLFNQDTQLNSVWAELNAKGFNNNEQIRKEAEDFARVVTDKEKILYCWYDSRLDFSEPFKEYIEKIEYIDEAIFRKVDRTLAKTNNVARINCNCYLVSQHPLSQYLVKRGLNTFDDFKKTIETCRSLMIYHKKTEYWARAIKNLNTYEQLNDYDSEYVDLSTLNNLLKIGLSKKEVRCIAFGEPLIRTRSGPGAGKVRFSGLDADGRICEPKTHGKWIYRYWFENRYEPYFKIDNDYEISAIGPNFMKYVGGKYIEDCPVTSKVAQQSKFKRFLTRKYCKEIEQTRGLTFSGENYFGFDKKCNSCLGFCVEYYAKIKLFGDDFYMPFIKEAMNEAKTYILDDAIRVRAAMLIYRTEMAMCYGQVLTGIIPTISVSKLIEENYSKFLQTVIALGNKTAKFVLDNLYNGSSNNCFPKHDPDLSVNHISALCDFLTKDTILDVKCTSSITSRNILQVLAYHYLSTKRSDLSVKRLIVYEAVTGKYVEINVNNNEKNS